MKKNVLNDSRYANSCSQELDERTTCIDRNLSYQIVRAIGILFSNDPNGELRNKESSRWTFSLIPSPLPSSSHLSALLDRFQPPPVVVASVYPSTSVFHVGRVNKRTLEYYRKLSVRACAYRSGSKVT